MAVKITIQTNFNDKGIKQSIKSMEDLKKAAKLAGGGFSGYAQVVGKTMDQVGQKIASTGKSMTRNLTVPMLALGAGAYKAIQAGSDLSETISKVGVIFDGSGKQIEEWSKTAATAMGQSRQQAMDAASTFATFGKAAGVSGNDLVKFSTDLTGLSADLASFYNTSPEDAIQAIGAALRGESEPIRRYGVLLNDAAMKQEAMAMGIYKGTGTLTAQQKVLAAQSLIFKQTKDAQGDFARTSDGLANQQRILQAQLKNTTAELGTALLPIALKAAGVFRDQIVPAIQKAVDWFGGLSEGQKELIVKVGLMVAALGPAVVIFGKITSGVGQTITALSKIPAVFSAVSKGAKALQLVLAANPWILIATAVAIAAVLIIKNWDKIKTFVLGAWNAIKNAASTVWNAVVGVVKGAASKVWAAIQAYFNFYKKMAEFGLRIVEGLWDGIKNAAGWINDKLKGFGSSVLNSLKSVFGISSPSKHTKKQGVELGNGLIAGINIVEPQVITKAKSLGDKTVKALASSLKTAKSKFQAALKEVKNQLDSIMDDLTRIRQEKIESTSDRITRALDAVREAANNMVDKAQEKWQDASDQLKDLQDQARSFAASIRDSLRAAFSLREALTANNGKSFIENLRDQLAAFKNFSGQIRQLRSMGLNENSMDEIIQAGVEQGTQIASAILAGGSSAVQEINSLESQITREASALGNLFSQDKFGKELEAAQKNLNAAAQALAKATAARDAIVAQINALQAATDAILGKGKDALDTLVDSISEGLGDTSTLMAQILAMVQQQIAFLMSLMNSPLSGPAPALPTPAPTGPTPNNITLGPGAVQINWQSTYANDPAGLARKLKDEIMAW